MKVVINILILAFIIFAIGHFLPGVSIHSYATAIYFTIVLELFNLLLRPLALFISFPIRALTFGLVTLIINGLTISLVDFFLEEVYIDSFLAVLWFSVLVYSGKYILKLF